MQWKWFISLYLISMILNLCSAQQTADALANNKTKQILAYLAGLPQQGISLYCLWNKFELFIHSRKITFGSICWL